MDQLRSQEAPAETAAPGRRDSGNAELPAAPATVDLLAKVDAAQRATLARSIQLAGNASTGRYLARQPQPQTTQPRRQTLKEKVEEARRTDPVAYVMKAVRGMTVQGSKWTFSEQAAEITWRIIWMFLPGRINATLVRADSNARGVELDPTAPRGYVEVVVGPSFLKGLTEKNVRDRAAVLDLVFLGKEKLIEKLKADFGFEAVTDGSSTWTGGELAVVHVALAKLPNADRGSLSGVTLRRASTLTHDGEPKDGLFEWNVSGVASGSSTEPTLTQTLSLADSAFADMDEASLTTVHEAGHAVETDKRRRAKLATGIAIAAENATINTLNNAGQAATAAMNGGINRFNRYLTADRTAATAFVQSVRAAHTAINGLVASNSTNAAARETAANTAVATRNTRRAALPSSNPADGDFATACDLQDDWLAAASAFVAARTRKEAAQRAEAGASGATTPSISRRLERFTAIVRRHNIAPITPYARQNWPAHPEEFFAEAYTMWRHDPDKLESLARQLKKFFDDGEHLK